MAAIELFGDQPGETQFKVPMETEVRAGDWATESKDPGAQVVAITFTSLDTNDEVVKDTFVIPVSTATLLSKELHRVAHEATNHSDAGRAHAPTAVGRGGSVRRTVAVST